MPWSVLTEFFGSGQHQSSGAGASQPQVLPNTQMNVSGIQSGAAIGLNLQQQQSMQQLNNIMSEQLGLMGITRGFTREYSSVTQRYTASDFTNLFINIGAMACSIGANIRTVIVDRNTYVRILNDLGSIQRSENSNNLVINTAMGPIKIEWRDTDSNFSIIDFDKYMEDIG